jgi:hypothetical protein
LYSTEYIYLMINVQRVQNRQSYLAMFAKRVVKTI